MGREVRRVPPNWHHPAQINARTGAIAFVPLLSGSYAERAHEWDEECAKWERGEFPEYATEENRKLPYAEWGGPRPVNEGYMPQWTPEEASHFMMYEDTSEGTPISPAFATPEELARWLVDHKASAFGSTTATYEGWLRVARGGYACSAVVVNGQMTSGVDGIPA